jgi:hypothetical protein
MEQFVRNLTTVFWVAAPLCVVVIAVSSFTQSAGVLWTTGVALFVVMLSSGGIAWVGFKGTP